MPLYAPRFFVIPSRRRCETVSRPGNAARNGLNRLNDLNGLNFADQVTSTKKGIARRAMLSARTQREASANG